MTGPRSTYTKLRPLAVRAACGRSLADAHELYGPAIGDAVRITAGCERGVSATVTGIAGRTIVVLTAHRRTLSYGISELAPIAPAIGDR